MLEEADLEHLGVRRTDTHVEAGVVALCPQEVAIDGRRQHPEVGDADPGRAEARDHRALDHPTGGRRVAARDDAAASLERRAERSGEPDRDLGREIDVDDAGDALAAEQVPRGRGLPDHALVHRCAGLDLLVGKDTHARHDDGLWPDDHAVAERNTVVDARMRADVARTSDDRPLDDRVPARRTSTNR